MPLFRCFAAWLACSASVEWRSCPTTHTQSHSQSHVLTHVLRRRTGRRWGSLEMSRRARLDASLLACRASATRSLSKSAKVSQTSCPFHSLFPDLPGLALLWLAPPLLSLLPRLQRHGILLRKKRRLTGFRVPSWCGWRSRAHTPCH